MKIRALLGLAAAALAYAPAYAGPINYDLHIFYNEHDEFHYGLPPEMEATFQLDSNPTPEAFWDSDSFNISATVTYSNGVTETDLLRFYDETAGGGFDLFPSFFSDFSPGMPVLFTGSLTAPTMISEGQYSNVGDYFVPGQLTYSLTISPGATTTPSVPEPATWAMMIGGFAMTGGALRRRAKVLRLA